MQQLYILRAGASLAVTVALLNAICAVAFVLAPDAATQFFNSWMHGIDLTRLRSSAPITAASVAYGIVTAGVVAFVAGVVFTAIHNALNRTPSA